MIKIWKKLLLSCLALCMILSLATACKMPQETEEEPPKEPEQTVVFDQPLSIIYAQSDGAYGKEAALLLRESLQKVLGYRPTVVTDRAFKGDSSENCVLILGDVVSIEVPEVSLSGEIALQLMENGAYLCAKSDIAMYMAAKKLAELWPTSEYGYQENTLILTDGMCKTFVESTPSSENLISVMSQNIRCANDPDGNYIADRKGRFFQLMEDYQPDLLGTQETTKEWNDIFEEYFGEEYGMVGCSRDGKDAKSGEWNTILYKKSRFELIESDTFWLTATPDVTSKVDGALCRRICTWAILKDRLTGKEIFFANTHLDHSDDTIRGIQAEYLMQYLAPYMREYPTFLTGDFNTSNKGDPYKVVTDELLDAHKSADVDASTVEGTFHKYGQRTPYEIDFCFHSSQMQPLAYRILSETYAGYVSDHYGLIAYFQS